MGKKALNPTDLTARTVVERGKPFSPEALQSRIMPLKVEVKPYQRQRYGCILANLEDERDEDWYAQMEEL